VGFGRQTEEMVAMSGIIVGIDGSAHAQRALEWAVEAAAVRDEPLTVLTVWRTAVASWGAPVIYPGDQEAADDARRVARDALDKAVADVGAGRPVKATVRAVSGIPAAELVAASAGADLLVIGSRGTGGFARLLLGSVAQQVVHHAHCPVVVVPDEDRHG
jgi:nucleotide-binding universal stress UspA family protein